MNKDYITIEAGSTEKQYWRDLWSYRELFYILAWRDISVRYKQTIIGLIWVLLQPFLTMLIFTLVFSKVAKLPTENNIPYALLIYAGLLPWQLFSTALMGAANSFIGNVNLINKVYFPRLIVPTSAVMGAFVDFIASFFILVGMMVWYKIIPGWQIITLPLFILMAFFVSLGPGLLFASLNVKYRDFRHIMPFVVQTGIYISPVGYSSSIVPERWQLIYSFNPLVGIIDGFRWAILGGTTKLDLLQVTISAGVIVFFIWLGIYQFRKMEKSFADLI